MNIVIISVQYVPMTASALEVRPVSETARVCAAAGRVQAARSATRWRSSSPTLSHLFIFSILLLSSPSFPSRVYTVIPGSSHLGMEPSPAVSTRAASTLAGGTSQPLGPGAGGK